MKPLRESFRRCSDGRKAARHPGILLLLLLFFICTIIFSWQVTNAHAQCEEQEGCVGTFGVPGGIAVEVNENFLSDILHHFFRANGLLSPRGDEFLARGDMRGYGILSEPFALLPDYRELPWSDRAPGYWDNTFNHDDDVYLDTSNHRP